jgi:hypothetical protein
MPTAVLSLTHLLLRSGLRRSQLPFQEIRRLQGRRKLLLQISHAFLERSNVMPYYTIKHGYLL